MRIPPNRLSCTNTRSHGLHDSFGTVQARKREGRQGKARAVNQRNLSQGRPTMDPALIAVIGTLGGVVVTSASGITVAWFTARIQRDNIDRQRAHDIAEHRRAERRETFVEYLAASASFAKGTGDARAPRTSRRQARRDLPSRGRPLQPRLPSPPTSRSPLTEPVLVLPGANRPGPIGTRSGGPPRPLVVPSRRPPPRLRRARNECVRRRRPGDTGTLSQLSTGEPAPGW